MPPATRTRLFSSHLLLLLTVFAGLMSSCQSTRPGFSFQPAPQRTARVAAPATATAVPDSVDATVAVAPVTHVVQPAARAQRKARRQVTVARMAAVTQRVLAPKIKYSTMPQRRALLQRPHATAEAGLGTTVLGVLGLVVLPIALIGLAISGGGLVWAIVAGLAALAVLVAWLDPFGR